MMYVVLPKIWSQHKLIDCFSPAGFNIKCKNCTIQGSIELVAGSFAMNLSSNADEGLVNATEGIIDYVEHGYMQFTSNNFMAHIELDSTVTASEQLTTFTAPLPTIPITPFQVCILC